ncbi:EF-hand domain-containing protein, partial [bacterium]|nr:EF-hand domain-containing protein [bacterium]
MKLKKLLLPPTAFLSMLLVNADGKSFGNGQLPEYLRKFDANKDGHLDEEERQAIKALRKKARNDLRTEIDMDGDGRISRVEIQAAAELVRVQISERRAEQFTEIAGEDGVISRDEFALIPGLSRVPEERSSSIFARLDADESGAISLDEFIANLRNHGNPNDDEQDEQDSDDSDYGEEQGKGKG